MRGSVKWQVNRVFSAISQIGQSRYEAKHSVSYKNPHELGQKIGIFSYKTMDVYKGVARDLLNFTKTEGLCKDIEKLTPEMVRQYLESKIEQGVSYNTVKTYCAAINKLEVALHAYNGRDYGFDEVTQEILEIAKEELGGIPEQHRAFDNPEKVIENIQTSEFRTIAEFQLASGLRLSELNHIRLEQLREEGGKCYVDVYKGKGGKNRTVKVRNKEVFERFRSLVERNRLPEGSRYAGKFVFDKVAYDREIKAAAEMAGEKVTRPGSHCFRWNFAQEEFTRLQIEEGYSREEALQEVAENLGHNREEITEHYLR